MKNRVLILIVLLVSGCAQTEMQGIDPKLQPHIDEIEKKFEKYNGEKLEISIPVNFKSLDGAKAMCSSNSGVWGSSSEVFVDPIFYFENQGSDKTIQTFLLHEIGHCLFGAEHDESSMKIGDEIGPQNIMFPFAMAVVKFMPEMEEHYYQSLIK